MAAWTLLRSVLAWYEFVTTALGGRCRKCFFSIAIVLEMVLS